MSTKLPRSLTVSLALLAALLLAACAAPSPSPTAQPSAAPVTDAPTTVPTQAPTTAPTPQTYSWRGLTLTLAQPLPEGPSEAQVFELQPAPEGGSQASQALAAQLGLRGGLYTDETGALVIADGDRWLRFTDPNNFYYVLDPASQLSSAASEQPPDAEQQIRQFLAEHGFDDPVEIRYADNYGSYSAMPLSSDGFTFRHEHFSAAGFLFGFYDGQIASINASLDTVASLGSFPIISAETALQKALDPNPVYGTLEGVTSIPTDRRTWLRDYPLDQDVTLTGWLRSLPSAEGGAPWVTLGGVPVTGDLAGLPQSASSSFVLAEGQFHNQDGTPTFELASWQPAEQQSAVGTLQQEGDQVVLDTPDQGKLLMPDVSADVPLPLENVFAIGNRQGDTFQWEFFDMRLADGGRGGGGGGGLGLYAIDLDGNPEDLPTPPLPDTGLPSIGVTLQSQRGLLTITLYTQPDGTTRQQLLFFYTPAEATYPINVLLQGDGLDSLVDYHNRPIDIDATIVGTDEYGTPIAQVEDFSIPYPDLQIDIFDGVQDSQPQADPPLTLFTANGQTYALADPNGLPTGLLVGASGDRALVEGLAVPDELYAGVPVLRVFSAALNTDDNANLQVTADQPYVLDEPSTLLEPDIEPPTLQVEQIELVYFSPRPPYGEQPSGYVQPMWRFAGHYTNGDAFEFMVQALDPQYLAPEIETIQPPG